MFGFGLRVRVRVRVRAQTLAIISAFPRALEMLWKLHYSRVASRDATPRVPSAPPATPNNVALMKSLI